MKIYKCDICGKPVNRPSGVMYCCLESVGISKPNKLEMTVVTEDGDISTELSFDLCEDCSKYIYNCLNGFKKIGKFNSKKEHNEFTNKSDA